MSNTAKLGLIYAVGALVLFIGARHFLGAGKASAYAKELEKRPYTERDLSEEYGIDPNWRPSRGGGLSYLSTASHALKVNNCIEAEASRIQIEYEDYAGYGSLLHSLDTYRIAHNRFEDQGLLPPKD